MSSKRDQERGSDGCRGVGFIVSTESLIWFARDIEIRDTFYFRSNRILTPAIRISEPSNTELNPAPSPLNFWVGPYVSPIRFGFVGPFIIRPVYYTAIRSKLLGAKLLNMHLLLN